MWMKESNIDLLVAFDCGADCSILITWAAARKDRILRQTCGPVKRLVPTRTHKANVRETLENTKDRPEHQPQTKEADAVDARISLAHN